MKGDITAKKETELKQLTGRQLTAETYSGTCDLPFTSFYGIILAENILVFLNSKRYPNGQDRWRIIAGT